MCLDDQSEQLNGDLYITITAVTLKFEIIGLLLQPANNPRASHSSYKGQYRRLGRIIMALDRPLSVYLWSLPANTYFGGVGSTSMQALPS
jgi:hypothetical protein